MTASWSRLGFRPLDPVHSPAGLVNAGSGGLRFFLGVGEEGGGPIYPTGSRSRSARAGPQRRTASPKPHSPIEEGSLTPLAKIQARTCAVQVRGPSVNLFHGPNRVGTVRRQVLAPRTSNPKVRATLLVVHCHAEGYQARALRRGHSKQASPRMVPEHLTPTVLLGRRLGARSGVQGLGQVRNNGPQSTVSFWLRTNASHSSTSTPPACQRPIGAADVSPGLTDAMNPQPPVTSKRSGHPL